MMCSSCSSVPFTPSKGIRFMNDFELESLSMSFSHSFRFRFFFAISADFKSHTAALLFVVG
jgi:hypothetical protein